MARTRTTSDCSGTSPRTGGTSTGDTTTPTPREGSWARHLTGSDRSDRWAGIRGGAGGGVVADRGARLAGEQVADLLEQQDVLGGSGGLCDEALLATLGELVDRHDDQEVDSGGDEQELQETVQDQPDREVRVVPREVPDAGEVRLAEERGDQRGDDAGDDGRDDGPEGCAQDDGDGKVDRVAACDEVLEPSQNVLHGAPSNDDGDVRI